MKVKKIPRKLARSILSALANAREPLPAGVIAERVKDDPDVPYNQRKSAHQMAYVLKQLEREYNVVEEQVLSSNGTSHHGTQRYRKGYFAPALALNFIDELIDAEKSRDAVMKQLTVNLPKECIQYLSNRKDLEGMSPGRVFEELIRTDVALRQDIAEMAEGDEGEDTDEEEVSE